MGEHEHEIAVRAHRVTFFDKRPEVGGGTIYILPEKQSSIDDAPTVAGAMVLAAESTVESNTEADTEQ